MKTTTWAIACGMPVASVGAMAQPAVVASRDEELVVNRNLRAAGNFRHRSAVDINVPPLR